MGMDARVSPKLEWLIPYLDTGVSMLPKRKKIIRLGAWDIKKSRGKLVHAAIFQDGDNGQYRIWMHTHIKVKKKIRPYTKIEILENLAHEIAHTAHWVHSCDHKIVECKILVKFMRMLKKEKYVSEEEEEARLKAENKW